MLEPVPLTGARREMTDRDRETRAIRELLQLPLPEPKPRAIAPAGIGGDHERPSLAIGRSPHALPPSADRVHGEARRVMIDPQTHPPFVAVEIVDAVRDRLPLRRDHEIVHPDAVRCSRGAPGPARVLEVPDQFLLLRIYRDRGLPQPLKPAHLPGDVAELPVAIRVLRTFLRLGVPLQAVAQFVEQFGDHRVADLMPHAPPMRPTTPGRSCSSSGAATRDHPARW